MVRFGLVVGPEPAFLELMKVGDLLVEKGLWLEHRLPLLLQLGLLVRRLICLIGHTAVLDVVGLTLGSLGLVGSLGSWVLLRIFAPVVPVEPFDFVVGRDVEPSYELVNVVCDGVGAIVVTGMDQQVKQILLQDKAVLVGQGLNDLLELR